MARQKNAEPATSLAGSLDELLASPAMKAIWKKHGKNIIRPGSDRDVILHRIPTGIFTYDRALGGGFPVGRISVVWGHKSSGKTTVLLKALASAQRRCGSCWALAPCACASPRKPMCAFLDVEHAFDSSWATTLGVDCESLLISQPEYAEQSLDIAEALMRNGVDVLILDSIAFLTPAREIVESVADEEPGRQARVVGKATRKFISALNTVANTRGIGPTLLFTNQVRMKVGVMFGSPEHQPGGLSTGFASSVEVKQRAGSYVMDDLLGKPITAEFHFRVEKNKCSPAKMEGSFLLALAPTEERKVGDTLDEVEMVKFAEKVGLVEGSGSSWKALGVKYPSKSSITRELVINPELNAQMRAALAAVEGS